MSRWAGFSFCMVVLMGGVFIVAGCDKASLEQAVEGLGIKGDDSNIDGSRPTVNGPRPENANGNLNANINTNGNSNSNSNTNGNANGNVNSNTNRNANTNSNINSNGNDNANGNTNSNGNSNSNGNDNTSGGLCADGSTRLEGEIESPVKLEAEYRRHPAGCARFRVKVRDYAPGSYQIFVNGNSVGTIQVGGNGRGEREFDTSDGNFPASFPMMQFGDVVHVGAYGVTMGNDCSSSLDSCNGNGNSNTNTNGNTNGNSNSNTNGNTNGNTNENTNGNANTNGNDNG